MKRLFLAGLVGAVFVTLLGLGTWQMQRLAWKEDLIAQAESRPELPPAPLADLVADVGLEGMLGNYDDDQSAAIEALAYRPVVLEGRFFGQPVRVFTALSNPNGAYEGPGYWLMHPFETREHLVFVNRGFIPFELPAETAIREVPTGRVRIEGLIRPDDPPNRFTPPADYEQNLLYTRSVEQLMEASGLSIALPVTVDMPAHPDGGLPQAGETKFTFSNRHLSYAMTWYGLALVLVGVVATVMIQRRNRN